MVIDHICFAVRNLSDGISYWEDVFGYKQMTSIIENSRQQVFVVFLRKEDSVLIKLIEPVESNKSLINFVNRGGGFHHICFKCTSISEQLTELTEKGLLALALPQPGEAFNNHDIAFLLANNGLIIELIDTEEKAGFLKE